MPRVAVSRVPRLHDFHDFAPLPPTRPALRGFGVKMEELERRLLRSGGPDPSFGGGNGLVLHDIFGDTNGITAIVEDAQGRIYAAGYGVVSQEAADADGSTDPVAAMCQAWLGRFNADGTLDTTFGDNGCVYYTNPAFAATPQAMMLQADGKIVMQANINRPAGDGLLDLGLIRFNPDGSVDETFGDNGLTRTDTPGQEWSYDMAIGADGSIVLAGTYQEIEHTEPDIYTMVVSNLLVIRYDADGHLDTNFGDNGILRDSFGGDWTYATGVEVLADGRIVVAGGTAEKRESDLGLTASNEFLVVRYNLDGSRDTTFGGGDGFATTDFGDARGGGDATHMVIDDQGRITCAGRVLPEDFEDGIGDGYGAFVRFTADGAIDTSFGDGGVQKLDHIGQVGDLAIDHDGRLVLTGSRTGGMVDEIQVSRYHADGSLDTTFADDGFSMLHAVDEGIYDSVNGAHGTDLLISNDGDYLVSGMMHTNGGISDAVLAKFLAGDATAAPTEPETPGEEGEEPETPASVDTTHPTRADDGDESDTDFSVWSDDLIGATAEEDEDLLAGMI